MRTVNFSAGPAMLPEPVMKKIQKSLLDFDGMGASVIETSHRSKSFMQLAERLKDRVRLLLTVPDDFEVLLIPGGARMQFSAIPMNMLDQSDRLAFITTGLWSNLAYNDAKAYVSAYEAATASEISYEALPCEESYQAVNDAKYLYYCANETVDGVEFHHTPATNVQLIADMSSNLFSKSIDFSKHSCVFACAQKTFGTAGLTVVIIKRDAILGSRNDIPPLLDYRKQAEKQSLLNTVDVFSWYCAHEVLGWLIEEGGVDEMKKRAEARSAMLYDFIDSSDMYYNSVVKQDRSYMNVIFDMHESCLLPGLLAQAEESRLIGLKGHRSRGGARASLYHAMTIHGVERLLDFLHAYQTSPAV